MPWFAKLRWMMALPAVCGIGALTTALPATAETLVIAATVTPGGFDPDALRPNTQNVVAQVYDTLVVYPRERQPDGTDKLDFTRVVPRLAESWTASADGKTYVFKLKQGVKSPFGNEMTADDVVWSWEKSVVQKRAGLSLAIAAAVVGVEKVSTYEVRFNLSDANQIFLRALAHYTPAIYDSREMKRNATAADPWALKFLEANTAGFGPYHLQSVRQGEQAIFIANPNYHGEKPFYDRVVYREVPSPGNRMQLLRTGQVQWIEELTHLQFQELRSDPRIKVVESQGTSMASARMNAKYKPFDDLRVRQALAYATDYEAVKRVVFLGAGSRPRSLIPPVIPGSDPSFYPFETNYEKARALLREAGYPNGLDITLEYAMLNWWEEGVAIALQQSMAQAGIRLQAKRITDADMRARSAPGVRDLPFFTFRDYPVILDPAYKLFIDAHPEGPSDRNAYDNPEFLRLVKEALVTFDEGARNAKLREAQRLHAEDVSWIYIMYPGHFEAMPACMQGYAWYPDYHERWSNLRCVR